MQIPSKDPLTFFNQAAFDLRACPVVDMADFRTSVIDRVQKGCRICSLFGFSAGKDRIRLMCVLANDDTGTMEGITADAETIYPNLTDGCPAAHWFEREIHEQWDILPKGHPWLKPIRFQPSMENTKKPSPPADATSFFRINGEEGHEVAVGPVHAGIIEPGHFRFQCHGETVYHLEISLGYQHRGVERALKGGPDKRTRHYFETLSGDTSIGHATAGCSMVEALAQIDIPARGKAIRAIAAELERIANHIGDIGAIAGDVGFLPTSSYCGRIRGDVLNMTAMICGNRFGRGLVIPGGTAWDIPPELALDMIKRLDPIYADAASAIELMLNTPSVLARLENTGTVTRHAARLNAQ